MSFKECDMDIEGKIKKKIIRCFFFIVWKLNQQTKDLSDEPTYNIFLSVNYSLDIVSSFNFLWLRLQRYFSSV